MTDSPAIHVVILAAPAVVLVRKPVHFHKVISSQRCYTTKDAFIANPANITNTIAVSVLVKVLSYALGL